MSQRLIYELLEELGGCATTTQISKLAKQKYPTLSLHAYVGNRLNKLKKWGYVDYITKIVDADENDISGRKKKKGFYIIKEKYIE